MKLNPQQNGTTKKVTADVYSGSGLIGNASVSCPGNILSDISRLEVLIGGKQAGNNFREIINKAVDISRWHYGH